ncbi:MAG: hypothetical protein HUK20_11220 [Fibrobacter sp.]|nr:hypothetical protein [Fibrobacter sp.]
MKLQDAFVSETGAYYGSWNVIGYTAPGQTAKGTNASATGTTANFKYEQAGTYDADKQTAALSNSDVKVWAASNLIKLNDCPADENWTVSIKSGSATAGSVTYTPGYNTNNKDNCKPLTASFDNIGK